MFSEYLYSSKKAAATIIIIAAKKTTAAFVSNQTGDKWAGI